MYKSHVFSLPAR